jgi:multimeric flavodoxin WrbA
MAKVLIVYHSRTGNTEEMAKAVEEGARSIAGVEVIRKKAEEASAEDLLGCDAVAFGSPENIGYMTGVMKEFFDRSIIQGVMGKVKEKPYIAFGSFAVSGKGVIDGIENVCNLALGMKKVADGVAIKAPHSPESLAQCRDAGRTLAKVTAK